MAPRRHLLWECRHHGGLWLPLPAELFCPSTEDGGEDHSRANLIAGQHCTIVMPYAALEQSKRQGMGLPPRRDQPAPPFCWGEEELSPVGFLTMLEQAARQPVRVRL